MKRILTTTAVAAGLVLGSATPAHARTPRACLTALDQAEVVQSIAGEFAGDVSAYFDEVQESASRNSTGGLDGVTTFLRENTESLNSLTAKMNDLAPLLATAKSAYQSAAAKCRKGGK